MKPKHFYSQNGEDIVLWSLFKDQEVPGFFIEVGALDGLRFSNTYAFEESGWSGLCIEAHPDYITLLRKNRPNSIVIHAAVGSEDCDSVDFYANARGSLSTLNPLLEEEFRKYGDYFSGWEVRKVPLRTLNSILEEYHIEPPIDLVSIDIEGTELLALRGFDLQRYKPRVLVVEAFDETAERELNAYFEANGYRWARRIANNVFYCHDEIDANILRNASNQGYLIHTIHPLDAQGGTRPLTPLLNSSGGIWQARSVAEIVAQTPLDYSHLADDKTIGQFSGIPENVYLVSFPRTGSHWLRMLLELYFDRPTLTRIFYKHPNERYLLLHHHDLEGEIVRERVIYLYRNPVDTVFSQLNYYQEDENDVHRIVYWSNLYARHLNKWLVQEQFTHQKLVLRYEDLKQDAVAAIKKICQFYEEPFDEGRAREACEQITKEHVRNRIEQADDRVVNAAPDYEKRRRQFRENHKDTVWNEIGNINPTLKHYLESRPNVGGRIFIRSRTSQDINNPKIVGLVAARNEREQIGFCLKALSLFTDAIVYLDDCSDDDSVEIVEKLAKECHIERIVRKNHWHRDEPGDRNELLRAGREIGGTHFILMDADETFTANCATDGLLRGLILGLKPGERLAMRLIHLWRSIHYYRSDQSLWSPEYREHIFCDDGVCSYDSDFIHTPRAPQNLTGKTRRLEGDLFGILHFQFVNWRNMLIKQAWYRCLERIRHPERSIEEINNRYAPSKDETFLGLKPSPKDWFVNYPFFDASVFSKPEQWRLKQMVDWLREYGVDYFADLDIWDIDWHIDDTWVLPKEASNLLRFSRWGEKPSIIYQEGCYADEGGWRWLNERASIWISQRAIPTQSKLSMELACGKAEFYERFPFDVQIYLNGKCVKTLTFKNSDEVSPVEFFVYPLEGDLPITIESNSSFVPARKNLSEDQRRLSVRLMGIRIENMYDSHEGGPITSEPEETSDSPALMELIRVADEMVGKEDYEAALDPLSQALRLCPDSPELINAYGNVLLRLNRIEEARQQFVKATVFAPNYEPAYAGVAVALIGQGKYHAAEAVIHSLLRIAPQNEEGKILLNEIQKILGSNSKEDLNNAEIYPSECMPTGGDGKRQPTSESIEGIIPFYHQQIEKNSDDRDIASIMGKFFDDISQSPLLWNRETNQIISTRFDPEQIKKFLEKFDWGEETKQYHLNHLNRYLLTLDNVAELPKTCRVLEIGAAPFGMTHIMKEYLFENVTPTSFEEKNSQQSSRVFSKTLHFYDQNGEIISTLDVPYFNVEIHQWPFDDESFDLVMACEIFEHLVLDPMHVIEEANRVLCPGGYLLITVPNVLSVANVHRILSGKQPNIFPYYRPFGAYGRHNRELSKSEVEALLGAGGFDITVSKSFDIRISSESPLWLKWLVYVLDGEKDRRGDLVLTMGRKAGPVRERYPLNHELYYSWDIRS